MVRLVDAFMICYTLNGKYVPKHKRQSFTVKITEVSAYTIEVITDSLDNACSIAEKIFEINKNMFDKDVTVRTTDCNKRKRKSRERIRHEFSRYDPQP